MPQGEAEYRLLQSRLFAAARGLLTFVDGPQTGRVKVQVVNGRTGLSFTSAEPPPPVDPQDTGVDVSLLAVLTACALSPFQAEILLALEAGPLKAQAVARHLRMELTTKLKFTLSTLRERSILAEDADGYRVARPEFLALARRLTSR